MKSSTSNVLVPLTVQYTWIPQCYLKLDVISLCYQISIPMMSYTYVLFGRRLKVIAINGCGYQRCSTKKAVLENFANS